MSTAITKPLRKAINLWRRRRKGLTQPSIRADLVHNQWLSSAQLKELQWRRLKRLLKHAYEYVPYYRQQFENLGITPRDVRCIEDFQRLPILRKSDIQQNIDWLLATNYDKCELKKDATGGSTGQPLTFYRDQKGHEWTWLAFQRFRNWIGYQPSDKLALIWGTGRDIPSSHPPNQCWLNSYNCSSDEIQAFIQELVRWQPKVIRGYASSLYLVASYIKAHQLTAPRPEAIESSAETLRDFQRAVVEDVFQCEVFNLYGSREIPSIACECEYHNGLHIFSDIRLIEIIRDGSPAQPGEEGSIIITDLLNYGMPFIRYEIGDVGVISKELCPCGRGFPLLEEVKGRITSTIMTPDGRYVWGGYFTRLFYHAQGVNAFQVRQRSIDEIEVSVQPSFDFNPSVMEHLVGEMQAHLGPEVTISWQIVTEIPLAPSGKRHYNISDIPVDFISTSLSK